MSEIVNRLTRCPVCNDTFTYRYQTTVEQNEHLVIRMRCPFCKTRLAVDVNSYTRRKDTIFRSVDDDEESQMITLELPEELQATVEE